MYSISISKKQAGTKRCKLYAYKKYNRNDQLKQGIKLNFYRIRKFKSSGSVYAVDKTHI